MTPVVVRPYRFADLEAVRRISCETALCGQPIDALFWDRQIVADALVGYYTELEQESVFVADAGGHVVGYLTGCVNTRSFERLFTRKILPRLIWSSVRKGLLFRGSFWRLVWAVCRATFRWSQRSPAVIAEYPAHCHLNLDPGFRQAGTGLKLFEAFLNRLREQGVFGIHIVTSTEPGKAFFRKTGFTLLTRYPTPRVAGFPPREAWVMGKRLSGGPVS